MRRSLFTTWCFYVSSTNNLYVFFFFLVKQTDHPMVAEAAVVGFPHEVKGEGVYAYVILKVGCPQCSGAISGETFDKK